MYRLAEDLRAEQRDEIFPRARSMSVPREPVNRKTLGSALDRTNRIVRWKLRYYLPWGYNLLLFCKILGYLLKQDL